MLAILFIYLLTIAFSYYGNRRLLICRGWDADGIITFVTFVPFVNVIWGLFSLIDSLEMNIKFKKMNYNKFFRITKDNKE